MPIYDFGSGGTGGPGGGGAFEDNAPVGMVAEFSEIPSNGKWLALDGQEQLTSSYPELAGMPGFQQLIAPTGINSSSKEQLGANPGFKHFRVDLNGDGSYIVISDNTGVYFKSDDGQVFTQILTGEYIAGMKYKNNDNRFLMVVENTYELAVYDPDLGTVQNSGFSLPSAIAATPSAGGATFETDGEGTYVFIKNSSTSNEIMYNTTPYDLSTFTTISVGNFTGAGQVWSATYCNNRFMFGSTNVSSVKVSTTQDFMSWNDETPGNFGASGYAIVSGNDMSERFAITDTVAKKYWVEDDIDGNIVDNTSIEGGVGAWIKASGDSVTFVKANLNIGTLYYTFDGFNTSVQSEPTIDEATYYSCALIDTTVVVALDGDNAQSGALKLSVGIPGDPEFNVPSASSAIPGISLAVKAES